MGESKMCFQIKSISDNIQAYIDNNLPSKMVSLILAEEKKNFKSKKFHLIKNDKGHEVFKFNFEGKSYYLKYYSDQKLFKRIKNLIRPEEGIRYFKISWQLLSDNIPVVKPVLAIKYRINLMKSNSLYVTKGHQAKTLSKYFLKNNYDQKTKIRIIKRLAALFAKLYKNKYIPGDPNLQNVLISKTQKLTLVDVDNIKHYPILPDKMILRNLGKLNALAYKNKEAWKPQDMDFFVQYCLEKINFNISPDSLYQYVNKTTLKKLTKWEERQVIQNNPHLLKLHERYFGNN